MEFVYYQIINIADFVHLRLDFVCFGSQVFFIAIVRYKKEQVGYLDLYSFINMCLRKQTIVIMNLILFADLVACIGTSVTHSMENGVIYIFILSR